MDEMEWPDRRGRQGWTDAMESRVSGVIQAEAERLALRARAAVLDPKVRRGPVARLDPPVSPARPVRRDHPAYLDRAVRRVNGARRVSRALREILARLVRRANL